jgi:hypothetical protein
VNTQCIAKHCVRRESRIKLNGKGQNLAGDLIERIRAMGLVGIPRSRTEVLDRSWAKLSLAVHYGLPTDGKLRDVQAQGI